MRMRWIAVLLFVVLSVGCEETSAPPPASVAVPAKVAAESQPLADAKQGFGYIPLNVQGQAADHVSEILQALQKFQTEHPGMHITSMDVDARQKSNKTGAYVFGIWVIFEKDK
jgi:hypothetical protein